MPYVLLTKQAELPSLLSRSASELFARKPDAKPNLTRSRPITPQQTSTPYTEQSHTTVDKMAAAIKALNAKIRSNPVADYFCSTR